MSQVVHETALPLLRPLLRLLYLLDCIVILRIIARHLTERNGTRLARDNLPGRTRFWVTVALQRGAFAVLREIWLALACCPLG